ncbi:ankyrin repeat-containing domain protein [Podospora aff. communis PSN243]|uniref:Ankyrin repeat-containing domain protein n=1 Tax=Podospora aff. communis PSN243 TaxID=3040156 RepID=A0AAV9GBR4_9PEZI|nr:ankyrin repeat-containing domain protein [Podospora aff. communis PSN243]
MSDGYEVVDHAETALDTAAVDKVREWLQPTDYLADSGEFRRHLSSQAPGTGLWICETDEYRKWHDSDHHGSLWIKGIPGAGKSVIAASLIQHLRTTENHPVLFFFFRNIVSANFSPRALIQDWLAQLLPHSPKLQFALQPRSETNLAEISDGDLFQHFLDGLSCVEKVYCIADALDEMESDSRQAAFLERLNHLATHQPAALKLLMTSRPKRHLQSALRDSSIVHISLQQRLVDVDIVAYLRHRLDQHDLGEPTRQKIVDMVTQRSEGLFLYAKLAMDQISRDLAHSDHTDINALEASLPVGLEQTYNAMLAKQRERNGVSIELQVHVLEAVTHAARPLRLNELTSLTKCTYPDLSPPGGLKALIATCCGSLVEVLEDETLQIIHHSFTEFLRGDTRTKPVGKTADFPLIDSEAAHKRMTMHCLRYLRSGSMLQEDEPDSGEAVQETMALVFRNPQHKRDYDEEHHNYSYLGLKRENDPFDYRQARLSHPFLAYAIDYWTHHARRYDVHDEAFFTAITSFLDPNSLTFLRWLLLQWGTTSETRGSQDGIPTALHIAAFAGLSKLALALLTEDSALVSKVDAQQRVPLHWAAQKGHPKVAALLIQHGADPNAEDGRGLKPIHLAARNNHAAVLKLLLEAGVEPDTVKTKEDHSGRLLGGEAITRGQDAILYAAQRGHTECVKAMIPFCNPETLERLLCECCNNGRSDAVLAILENSNVSPDAMFRQATALYYACLSANVRSTEALIRRGADVGKMSTYFPRRRINGGPSPRAQAEKAPIHVLIDMWWEANDEECRAILQCLVKAGADLEQLDGDGDTPLAIALGSLDSSSYPARRQLNFPALQALIEAGADINRTLKQHRTALHVASMFNNLKAIKLLVERGCDVNEKDKDGDTPLLCALREKREGPKIAAEVAQYLLDQGADPNCRDEYGHTAASLAMSVDFDLFRTLLGRCKDDKRLKEECWFGLSESYSIAEEDFVKYVDLLLAEGVDINTRGRRGNTLYLLCLGKDKKTRILRDRGADPCVVNDSGENALFSLLRSAHQRSAYHERLEHLIADGIDPLSTDKHGNTLLHQAAGDWKDDVEHVKWLLGLGIPLNAVNNKGQTALHVFWNSSDSNPSGFGYVNSPGMVSVDETVHFLDAIGSGVKDVFGILDNDGLGVIHLAAMTSEYGLAKLVEAGADLGLLTKDSQNVLHLAARARRPGILCQILAHHSLENVGINHKDDFDLTPLHVACASGRAESVALLLKHGADMNALGPQKRTALHLCAQFPLEQGVWDSHALSSWARGPSRHPLRPGGERYPRDSWYRHTNGKAIVRGALNSQVAVIAKMLIQAGIDVAAMDASNQTALDTALYEGCAPFVEVFASDKELLQRATATTEEPRSRRGKKSPKTSDEVNQKMMVHLALARPRSGLPNLRASESLWEEALQSPHRYLNLLSVEDAAELINESFTANPSRLSHYDLLAELLQPARLPVAENTVNFVKHYESYALARQYIEKSREANDRYYENPSLTSLQMACEAKECNLEMLRFLAETVGVDVNARYACHDGDTYQQNVEIVPGGTALHTLASAKYYWQVEGLRYLLAHGAEVDALDEKGRSALHIAVGKVIQDGSRYDSRSVWGAAATRVLLDHGADPNLLDKRELSPLHKSSTTPRAMELLLAHGANPKLGKHLPVFEAIFDQNLAALELLLDHGVDVNSVDETRRALYLHYNLKKDRKLYAIICAAFPAKLNHHYKQLIPLLRTLVLRGADLYAALNEDETAIHFLFEFPELPVQQELLSEGCASRIDFNRRDQRGRTVLMAACAAAHLGGRSSEKCDTLAGILKHGGDATLVDNNGKTALHHLLINEHPNDNTITEFINRDEVRPTLFIKDNDGYTPLHYALRFLRPEICELLLSKGANLLEADPNGQTALHHIAHQINRTRRPSPTVLETDLPADYESKCLALWNKCLSQGGSINTADNQGNTPLHIFILSDVHRPRYSEDNPTSTWQEVCHLRMYDMLFPADSGVDVFAVNNEGETMLHVAARRKAKYGQVEGHDKKVFVAFVAKGLDLLREDGKGRSALDVASACEKDDIVGAFRRS